MLAPLCFSCGCVTERAQFCVRDGQIAVAQWWCSPCQRPTVIMSDSMSFERQRGPLPSIAAPSPVVPHIRPPSLVVSMGNSLMEDVQGGGQFTQGLGQCAQVLV